MKGGESLGERFGSQLASSASHKIVRTNFRYSRTSSTPQKLRERATWKDLGLDTHLG